MYCKRVVLFVSAMVAALLAALPAAAMAEEVTLYAEGVPLEVGAPLTATSTNFVFTESGGLTAECNTAELNEEVTENPGAEAMTTSTRFGNEAEVCQTNLPRIHDIVSMGAFRTAHYERFVFIFYRVRHNYIHFHLRKYDRPVTPNAIANCSYEGEAEGEGEGEGEEGTSEFSLTGTVSLAEGTGPCGETVALSGDFSLSSEETPVTVE